jgi:predicted RNA methylase
VRALPGLIAALVEGPDEQVKALERAIARAGTAALKSALEALPALAETDRPRVFALLSRLAGDVGAPELYPALVSALGDAVPQSRKLAARALGKLGDVRAEGPLLEALGRAPTVEQKGIVDALGALGGAESRRVLARLETSDADLGRRRERACLLIERRVTREEPAALAFDERLAQPCQVVLTCRSGLAEVLAEELEGSGAPQRRGPDRVTMQFDGSLRGLLVARTALELGLSFPIEEEPGLDAAERIAAALTRSEAVAALQRWTIGVPRFRVAWTDGAHHRAQTWTLARAVAARTAALLNDSRQAPWTLRAPPDGVGEILLVPRLNPDPRFPYRSADVPAASHPTIAAALARFAGVRSDDVVWDPFVGSGLELVERARLGPARELWGSDIDPRALRAARLNLTRAGFEHARLIEKSALEFAPPGVSLIITNPPMGRRVARDGSLEALLEAFVRHAAAVLRPSGRLVWLSPLERKTERVARALGLSVAPGPNVDVGGFFARVQVLTRSE